MKLKYCIAMMAILLGLSFSFNILAAGWTVGAFTLKSVDFEKAQQPLPPLIWKNYYDVTLFNVQSYNADGTVKDSTPVQCYPIPEGELTESEFIYTALPAAGCHQGNINQIKFKGKEGTPNFTIHIKKADTAKKTDSVSCSGDVILTYHPLTKTISVKLEKLGDDCLLLLGE